jgi:hypothetical protein
VNGHSGLTREQYYRAGGPRLERQSSPAGMIADDGEVMSKSIFNSLGYVSVAVYLVYILVEGWKRLTPIF